MRLYFVIPGSILILAGIFLIGLTRTTPVPEQVYPSPNTAVEFINRGRLYEKRGDYEAALADYAQATQLDTTDSTAYLEQAAALAALNRQTEAIETYEIAKQLELQQGRSSRLIDYLIEQQQQQLENQH